MTESEQSKKRMFWVDFCERDESRPVPRSSPPQKPASSNELDPPRSVHLESSTTFDLFFLFLLLLFFFNITCAIPKRDRQRDRERETESGKVDGG